MTREIILDTETTGLDPRAGHRVIEIAALELVNRFPTGVSFHEFINPERDVPKDAEAVHGISTEFLQDKPVFAALSDRFVEFISDATLVIHNAPFDIGFLNSELARVEGPVIGMERVVDTLMLARRKHPAGPNSLDALCKRYQIDLSERSKHSALLDCKLLIDVYLHLIGGHQANLELVAEGRSATRSAGVRRRAQARPRALPGRLSEAEVAAHEAFVETLKAPLWPKRTET